MKSIPNLSLEGRLWMKGYRFIAGVDEVGRGAFAGPVVAASVVFSPLISKVDVSGIYINDSKQVSPKRRESTSIWIKENCIGWGIGSVSVAKINRVGIVNATQIAMRQAVSDVNKKLSETIDYLLLDAFYLPYVKGLPSGSKSGKRLRQTAVIKGDSISLSVAAASIIAKVYRDEQMTVLGQKNRYLLFGWCQNKGYGTHLHRLAIQDYGITRHHRKKFVGTFLSNL